MPGKKADVLDPWIIEDIKRREEEQRIDRRPHAPSPVHPDDVPEHDPEAERRWREEQERKDEGNNDRGVTVFQMK